jgi:di/tricarboxylate transporter
LASALSVDQWILLGIITSAIFLLISERIRIDLTALLIILSLALTGLLEPEQALAGFSSEPALVVAALFVLSGSLYYTGLSDRLSRLIAQFAGHSQRSVLIVIMIAVAGLSAFTHHLTATALMLPITLKLSRQQEIPASKLLMPMSFAASLGTTITILGAPAFLIADRLLEQSGTSGLGVFSIAPIGLAITLAGALFMQVAGRHLLPERPAGQNEDELMRLESYYTEIIIQPQSPLIGMKIDQVESRYDGNLKVINWFRQGKMRAKPHFTKKVRAGDVLLVRTTPEELSTVQEEPGVALHPVVKYAGADVGENGGDGQTTTKMIQAVISPGSEFEGQSVGQVNFLQNFGVLVIGIWRQRGWIRSELSHARLHAGDVLVLLSSNQALSQLTGNRHFLMLVPFPAVPFRRHKAWLAGGLMIGSVITATTGIIRTDIALLAGAVAAVLTGCISLRQAYRSIDTRIFVFIAGAIPLGESLVRTGMSAKVAGWLQGGLGVWPPSATLALLFILAALLTQLMSDAATTAILGPIAIALATSFGDSPAAYVVVVAMGAVASFLTPIGHHGNLLIYGPGGYRFRDFLLAGTPLTILVGALVILIAPLLWSS